MGCVKRKQEMEKILDKNMYRVYERKNVISYFILSIWYQPHSYKQNSSSSGQVVKIFSGAKIPKMVLKSEAWQLFQK